MNKIIKSTIEVVVLIIIGFLIYDNYNLISNKIEYAYKKYIQPDINQKLVDNEFRKKENYEYLKINTNSNINNIEAARYAIYTFLDAGWDTYTIKCDPDYLNCIEDFRTMTSDTSYLTSISNFISPYNTFNKINTSVSSSGKITFKKENKYTDEQIIQIKSMIDKIYNENYNSEKSINDNIKTFHDYIINNTRYDESNTSGDSNINSSTAYGVLTEHLGICSGYADTMSLFLDKMGVRNYRVSSDTHVWNLVFVDEEWKHIDVTFDDPVLYDGSQTLTYKYYMLDTKTLLDTTDIEHIFDQSIYIEAKQKEI